MKQLTVTRSEGTNKLFVKHTFDQELYNKLKSLPRIQWNNEKKSWLLPDEPKSIHLLLSEFRGIAWVDLKSLKKRAKNEIENGRYTMNSAYSNNRTTLFQRSSNEFVGVLSGDHVMKLDAFEAYLRSKRYSPNTIKTYSDSLRTFFRFCSEKPIDELESDDVIRFNKSTAQC
jgi:integrase/recombinase XerD